MGRRSRPKAKRTASDDENEAAESRPVIDISSSDEEANQDLSLAIVEKARQRDSKRKKAENNGGGGATRCAVIDISTSSDDPDLVPNAASASSKEAKMLQAPIESGKKKPKKKKKVLGDTEEMQVDSSITEEEATGKAESTVTITNVVNKAPESCIQASTPSRMQVDSSFTQEEATEKSESMVTIANVVNKEPERNVVLQNLLRGPRYFDLEERYVKSCFNCGEDSHLVADCPMEKKQKPCYVCGLFGHNSKQCEKEKDCYFCRRRGHRAKNCPEKTEKISPDSKFCLRCGDAGHVMSSCNNDYPPDDLKEIQCYSCRKFGHLCCFEFKERGPIEVSCYKCAQSGHSGMGCGKKSYALEPIYCYRCNEKGHFARGCTKSDEPHKWSSEMSTPKSYAKEKSSQHGSAPPDLRKARNKVSVYEDRGNMTTGKWKVKTGTHGDHSNKVHKQKHREKMWAPYTNSVRKSQRDNSLSLDRHGPSSWVPKESHSFVRTPNSHVHRRSYVHDNSPRFGSYYDLFRGT